MTKNLGQRNILLWAKTQVQYFKSCTLNFLIKFKHLVALTNKIRIILSFPRIIKFKKKT